MWQVKEVSRLTGVSVRALHHYDALGLLKPTEVTAAGYRLYDGAALARLQSILFFRELRFSLKEIQAILDSPAFDPAEAIARQIRLLELQQKRLGELIAFAKTVAREGITMDFKAFDTAELERSKQEVREKWGATAAYEEYAARGESSPDLAAALMAHFAHLGALRHIPPEDSAVQESVAALQEFITKNYYTCTREILASLGELYTGDARFRENIDAAGGPGTALFTAEAIRAYCEG